MLLLVISTDLQSSATLGLSLDARSLGLSLKVAISHSACLCRVCSARRTNDDVHDVEIQNVFLSSDGSCFWWTSITHSESHCEMDIKWFPFDTQQCSLVFESWTLDSRELIFTKMDPDVDLDYYKCSGEWDLTGE